jgi:hypothetical protein
VALYVTAAEAAPESRIPARERYVNIRENMPTACSNYAHEHDNQGMNLIRYHLIKAE